MIYMTMENHLGIKKSGVVNKNASGNQIITLIRVIMVLLFFANLSPGIAGSACTFNFVLSSMPASTFWAILDFFGQLFMISISKGQLQMLLLYLMH